MKMPIFCLDLACAPTCSSSSAFPILTAVLALLTLDRYVGTNFFTNDLGGNPMMYFNLIWIWGHPEVYILILPAFGIFSEVTSTYLRQAVVWLHLHGLRHGRRSPSSSYHRLAAPLLHDGLGRERQLVLRHHDDDHLDPDRAPRSSTGCSPCIAGRIRFEVPMLWTVGFMVTFVIGGMTGVLLAVPPADFVLHNSLCSWWRTSTTSSSAATFFGMMAGTTYWFPKAFGFKLDPFWGKMSFWPLDVSGFYFAFMPLYVLGLTRRHPAAESLRRSVRCRSGSCSPAFGAVL